MIHNTSNNAFASILTAPLMNIIQKSQQQKKYNVLLLSVYACIVSFWRYISDMALVRKHVVTLTFPNLGKMML